LKKSIPTGVAYGRSLALEATGFNVWREQTRLETLRAQPSDREKLLSPWRIAASPV